MEQIEDKELGSVLVDIKNTEWPLIISFAGLGDQFQFKKILAAFNVNVIYVRDLKHNWYLNGVPGVGENVQGVRDFFIERIRNDSFPKVITLGASAGGFAALLYGSLINADRVMAFSPQTFMDRFHRILYWDRRWNDREAEIYAGDKANRIYLDLKPLLVKYEGSAQLFFDRKHRLDRIHASRLKMKNVSYVTSDEGGHTLAKHLKDSGKLGQYLEGVING